MIQRLSRAMRVARYQGLRPAIGSLLRRAHRPGSATTDEVGIVFDALSSNIQRGTMVDVGAHHGSALREFVRSGWSVHAFEPDPNNREKLEFNYGRYPNLKIDPRAVSDTEAQETAFFTSRESTGISALAAFHPSHTESARVAVTTLSNYVAAHPSLARGIDFLKIDTEGFALNVLKGFPWDKVLPTTIVCEFEDRKTVPLGYSYHDLARYLTARGYRVIVSEWFPVVAYGQTHRWRQFARYPHELADPLAWGNYIAVKDPHLFNNLSSTCAINNLGSS
jgi:FkbM family methyltransferase